MLTGLILTFVAAKYYEPQMIGLIGLATLLGSLTFIVLDFGFMTQSLTLIKEELNKKQIVIYLYIKIRLLLLCTIVGTILVLNFDLPFLYFALFLSGYLTIQAEFFSNCLKANKDYKIEMYFSSIFNFCLSLHAFYILTNNASFFEFVLLIITYRLIGFLCNYLMICWVFKPHIHDRNIKKELYLNIKNSKGFYYDSIIASLINNVDVYLLQFFVHLDTLGIYLIARKVFSTSLVAMQAVSGVFLPKITNLITNKLYTEAYRLLHIKYFLLYGFIYSFIVAISSIFILEFFYGDSYQDAKYLICIFCSVIFIKINSARAGMMLAVSGRVSLRANIALLSTLIFLLTGIFFVNSGLIFYSCVMAFSAFIQLIILLRYEKKLIFNI